MSDIDALFETLHNEGYERQDLMRDPISYLASVRADYEKDTMYYHEAMRQSDSDKFIEAIMKEFNAHIANKHWSLIDKSEVPQEAKTIPTVW